MLLTIPEVRTSRCGGSSGSLRFAGSSDGCERLPLLDYIDHLVCDDQKDAQDAQRIGQVRQSHVPAEAAEEVGGCALQVSYI